MQDLQIERAAIRKTLNECLLFYRNCGRSLAGAERDFRVSLRKEFLRLHIEDNVAWTACEGLAKGDKDVADLRFTRDIRKSDYQVTYEKILVLKSELKIVEGDMFAERQGV